MGAEAVEVQGVAHRRRHLHETLVVRAVEPRLLQAPEEFCIRAWRIAEELGIPVRGPQPGTREVSNRVARLANAPFRHRVIASLIGIIHSSNAATALRS